MALQLDLLPAEAWVKYLAASLGSQGWLESSEKISGSIGLSRRELLGLILYSYYLEDSGVAGVCWDDEDHEPNDGYIALGPETKIRCEHKLVAQFDRDEVTMAIVDIHRKYSTLGKSYGRNRHLLIHANRQSQGLARISRLTDDIAGISAFDRVLLAGVNGFEEGGVIRFSVSEHYPGMTLVHLHIKGETGKLLASDRLSSG